MHKKNHALLIRATITQYALVIDITRLPETLTKEDGESGIWLHNCTIVHPKSQQTTKKSLIYKNRIKPPWKLRLNRGGRTRYHKSGRIE